MGLIKELGKKAYFFWHQDMRYYLDFKTNYYLYNIWSYCQNQALIQQGSLKETMEYQYYINIHKYLTVNKITNGGVELLRIGGTGDGGYFMIVNKDGYFSANRIAYSLGIAQDVSWDKSLAQKGYDIFQYDHSIRKLPEENSRFHWERIGITGGIEQGRMRKLGTLIKKNGHTGVDGMILKCDIEGYEWEMFDSLKEEQVKCFDQIVIELHGLVTGGNKDQIIRVLKRLAITHCPIHIHANNNGVVNYCGDMVTPDLLEVTFINKEKYNFIKNDCIFPLFTDRANTLEKQDVILGKWNIKEEKKKEIT